ncbi:uncharacterized protein LOC130589507 [Beta vulgaris subsp. vulgaris]|uniref:uncharacterized protein LOC130589507 n=1 Tax=Beta vulgaris subsp. vulgaris TaxID=3555 RepID=UPI002547BB8C|nr:uncharacterized protein LOC130589507 [Beta vulgaris subsp. vulgaris]
MLALLIPGPLSPGNDIHVYLQPLIKDLKELWEVGLETYDSLSNQRFDMHATLMSTISDFPAYAMLSGWSTKGKIACPACHYETESLFFNKSHKHCYMGHPTFLDLSHPWRRNKRYFIGVTGQRHQPVRLTGIETKELLCGFRNKCGKLQKITKQEKEVPWKRVPIFFKLPYWKHCSLRHNLDVMHIEKNVCDNIIATLLDLPGKSKDHANVRQDLKALNWMPELHPQLLEDGKEVFPKSRFSMSLEEKRLFCQVIKNAKLPLGYASNIARCVQVGERKITGYKSHDAHFLMHYLLLVAIKTTLSKDVAKPLLRLCAFFKGIWKKAIDPQDLDYLQTEIVETLCQLEEIFPPTFFDVMVHLPIHLVEEIKLGGPVGIRCMYAIERYLRELKSDVRNKGRPEGSMAERYLAKECLAFCGRYLNRSNNPSDNNAVDPSISNTLFPNIGRPIRGKGRNRKKKDYGFMMDHITRAQVHQYVLFNCDSEEVERYIE